MIDDWLEANRAMWSERVPFLVAEADGSYRLPAGMPAVPLMYSLLARPRA